MSRYYPPVLKLNSAYMPLDVIPWEEAMVLYFNGKADIVENYDIKLNTSSGSMEYPAVIRLRQFVRPKHYNRVKKSFTRRNVWERDGKSCVYCGKPISLSEMTFDHVHPQAKGGKTKWENIVSACKKCNSKKGHKDLSEINFTLRKAPFAPIVTSSFEDNVINGIRSLARGKMYPEWENYLISAN